MKIVYIPQVVEDLTDYLMYGVLGQVVKSAGEQAGAQMAQYSASNDIVDLELHEPTLILPWTASSLNHSKLRTEVFVVKKIGPYAEIPAQMDGAPTSFEATFIVDYRGNLMPFLKMRSNVSFCKIQMSEGGGFKAHIAASLDGNYYDHKIPQWETFMSMKSLNINFESYSQARQPTLPYVEYPPSDPWSLKIEECEQSRLQITLTDALLRAATEAATAIRWSIDCETQCTISNNTGVAIKFKDPTQEQCVGAVVENGTVANFVSRRLDPRLLVEGAGALVAAGATLIFELFGFEPQCSVPIQQMGEFAVKIGRRHRDRREEHVVLFLVSMNDGAIHISCESTGFNASDC